MFHSCFLQVGMIIKNQRIGFFEEVQMDLFWTGTIQSGEFLGLTSPNQDEAKPLWEGEPSEQHCMPFDPWMVKKHQTCQEFVLWRNWKQLPQMEQPLLKR